MPSFIFSFAGKLSSSSLVGLRFALRLDELFNDGFFAGFFLRRLYHRFSILDTYIILHFIWIYQTQAHKPIKLPCQ